MSLRMFSTDFRLSKKVIFKALNMTKLKPRVVGNIAISSCYFSSSSTVRNNVNNLNKAVQNLNNEKSVTEIPKRRRIVVAVTGATGIGIAVRLLQILKRLNIETHLIISKWGIATMKYETDFTLDYVSSLATNIYVSKDVSAPISSGSFQHDGMIIVPCSMKSLAAIRIGYTEDLIIRAADVTLKERRKLLLVTRETPLSDIHLDNMLFLSKMGTIIFPPVPAFYTNPESIEEMIEQTCGRILDCFGIHIDSFPRWSGIQKIQKIQKKG